MLTGPKKHLVTWFLQKEACQEFSISRSGLQLQNNNKHEGTILQYKNKTWGSLSWLLATEQRKQSRTFKKWVQYKGWWILKEWEKSEGRKLQPETHIETDSGPAGLRPIYSRVCGTPPPPSPPPFPPLLDWEEGTRKNLSMLEPEKSARKLWPLAGQLYLYICIYVHVHHYIYIYMIIHRMVRTLLWLPLYLIVDKNLAKQLHRSGKEWGLLGLMSWSCEA